MGQKIEKCHGISVFLKPLSFPRGAVGTQTAHGPSELKDDLEKIKICRKKLFRNKVIGSRIISSRSLGVFN